MLKKDIKKYLSPYLAVRYWIERDLKNILNRYSFRENVLDIGCGSMPYRNFFVGCEYSGIDFESHSVNQDYQAARPNLFFGEEYAENGILPIKDDVYSLSVAFQVLEHVPSASVFIKEMLRVTKPDGYIILSWPFIGSLHEEPNDFSRITHYKLKKIIEGNGGEIVEIFRQGGVLSTISIILNESLSFFASKSKFNFVIACCVYPPFYAYMLVALMIDKKRVPQKTFINYMALCRKK